jgi:Phage-related protein
MEGIKVQSASIDIEVLSEEEAKELQNLLKRFMQSYSTKGSDIEDKEWLKNQLQVELPHITNEEAERLSAEAIESIAEFDNNLASINQACSNGVSKEDWFANKVAEASTGVSVIDYGNYLKNIDTAITNANDQMIRTVTTNVGDISQCYNLDGFIAEQHHVNTFNMQATLGKSPFLAEVCVPESGQTYGLNSFDLVIKNISTGKIVHQYQCKFGADADATIALIKSGNYNNQRFLVPEEQVEAVKKAFPGKSVEAFIGGTDVVSIQSKTLTKQQAKELQLDAQQKNSIPSNDWNNYNTLDLAKHIGKNAGLAGVQAAVITTGFDLAAKVISGEKIDADETIEIALTTGADAGIKAATAGAIKVGAEKGIISVLPKGTPISVIANIACLGIENVKILGKVATGELTMTQALDQMGRTSTSMIYGMGWGANGAVLGAAALSWIPIVGPIVGGLVGGMVGYMAGSKVGNAIYSGLKTVGSVAKSVAKSAWNGVKSVGRAISSGVKSIGNAISSWF